MDGIKWTMGSGWNKMDNGQWMDKMDGGQWMEWVMGTSVFLITAYLGTMCSVYPPLATPPRSVEAAPEDISTSATKAEIMGGGEGTTKAEGEDHSTEDSYRLLKKELADLKQKPDRKQILKIHQGVVVMWARSVVGSILGRWPVSCKLSLVHLGCSSTTEYFSLLDLLLRGHDAEQCKQVSWWTMVVGTGH